MPTRKVVRFKNLRERHKRCFYCKCELVFYPLGAHEKTPDNFATIEHLNSRLQYPNGRPKTWGKSRTIVVACFRCNNDRATQEDAALPQEERWRRSGNYPLPEGICQRCLGINPVWFTDNDCWNEFAGEYHFLCPNCFIEIAGHDNNKVWQITIEGV